MTRVIAGRFGGRRLVVPPSGTRPTSDRAREGIFSTLEALLGGLDGARFLDLYAGSGGVGLEALSRGAAEVIFVESALPALKALRENIAKATDTVGRGAIVVVPDKVENLGRAPAAGPAGRHSPQPEVAAPKPGAQPAASGFDVVFADPPYDLASTALAGVVQRLVDAGALRPGAIVVVERSSRDTWAWPDGVEPLRERRYGDAMVWYGRAGDRGSAADQENL